MKLVCLLSVRKVVDRDTTNQGLFDVVYKGKIDNCLKPDNYHSPSIN